MMKRFLKTECIVFKKTNLLNKDKLVTLFTYDFGKMKVFAKGVRKIISKRLPHLETGNLIKVEIYKKSERFYLQESSLISGFYKIKTNPNRYKYLYLFLFVLNKLLPEEERECKIYKFVKIFLRALSEQEFTQKELDQFLNTLLFKLGFIKENKVQTTLYKTIEEIIDEKLPLLDYN